MKTTILFLVFLCVSGALKAEIVKDTLPPFPPSPVFFDFTLGFAPVVSIMASISMGYRFDKHHALGVDLIALEISGSCCPKSISGVGLQYRFTPGYRWLFKLESGYVTKGFYGDDSYYYLNYNRAKSSKIYSCLSSGLRFADVMWAGITVAGTGTHYNDYADPRIPNLVITRPFQFSSIHVNLGLVLPGLREAKKKHRKHAAH